MAVWEEWACAHGQPPRGQLSSFVPLHALKAKRNYPAKIDPDTPLIFFPPGHNEPVGFGVI